MASDWTIHRLSLSGHSLVQMFRRRITESEVSSVVQRHEIIAEYPDDSPLPSRLLLGFAGERPLHVVLAYNEQEALGVVVTAYEPDPILWSPDFRTRREP